MDTTLGYTDPERIPQILRSEGMTLPVMPMASMSK